MLLLVYRELSLRRLSKSIRTILSPFISAEIQATCFLGNKAALDCQQWVISNSSTATC
jgi:hypothetical protein